MPLDFPNSPAIGATYSPAGVSKSWIYTGEQWSAVTAPIEEGAGPWKVMSSAYTAVDGDRIAANTSGGAFTITLPASPVAGNVVNFADAADSWDTNNLTIARNGQTIEGLAENLVCDVVGDMTITLLYNGSTWRVYA